MDPTEWRFLMEFTGEDLLCAKQELERAKSRFHETLGKIEHALSPEGLADDAGRAIRAKMSEAVTKGVETARERPYALAAGASALLALIAGRPLWKAARRLTGAEPATTH
jgi:hypothetical protein